jgi:hypothetical protein
LLLGVEQNTGSSLWGSLDANESSKLHVHKCAIEHSTDLEKGHWDVIIVGSKVQFGTYILSSREAQSHEYKRSFQFRIRSMGNATRTL